MWILENFYWVLIVGFAVLSALSKSGKTKQKQQHPRGMPTFGNGGNAERRAQAPRSSPFSSPEEAKMPPSETASRDEERTFEYQGPGPDYDTGEGVSGMWEDERPGNLKDVQREMEQHLSRVNASLDRIEKQATEPASSPAARTKQPRPSSPLANEARNGLIWAEILGPPRAKRPYNGRK